MPASNHSLTDVQDYVRELPQNHVVDYTDASQFPQYRSMVDFVTTMRVAREPKGTAFKRRQQALRGSLWQRARSARGGHTVA